MCSPAAAWHALRLDWRRQDLFGGLRVRHGIKLGLAGLLALFWTQALRLPDANWAILTALVLMNGQYVGAFAFKSIMRLTGTVAGAVVGVWLASDYANTPVIFLTVFFSVMAFAGYRFGQVGARQVPYAYFLLGLTVLTIATEGVTDPEQAWRSGLIRTEEILVGIICSLFVSTLVWPRYAREEFLDAGRAALKTVSRLVSIHALAYIRPPDTPVEVTKLHDTFDRQFSNLRSLLQAGARESAVFSARLSDYDSFMVSLNNLFHAGLALNRHRAEAWFLEHVQGELESLFAAISDEFDILTGPSSPSKKLPPTLINEKFAVFEAKVSQIRGRGILVKSPLQTTMDFAGEFALLDWLTKELNNMRGVLNGLPPCDQPAPKEKPNAGFSLAIDWFWVKVGLKGALAAVIAIVLLKWVHPPGAANIPTWAWLFVVLRRTFLRVGSGSDLRGFQTALGGSLVLASCAVLLTALTPLLAGYAVMNLVLFLVLFATGFFTAKLSGLSFWSEFTFLTTSAFVALNPQVPVSSQTIIDSFVGTIFGLWIATIVSRLIWPVLPQRILRDNLVALFSEMKELLGGDTQEMLLTQLTTRPVEALVTVGQMRLAGCPVGERAKLGSLIRGLQTLISRLTQLVSRRNLLPEITEQIVRQHLERLEIEFKQVLDAFGECFRQGDCHREMPAVRGALSEMDDAVQRVRDRNLLGNLPPEASLRFLDIVDRYHATADALAECCVLISSLRIERYWGDLGM
jgi:p-hydroxybenzoic acid efflux pump subunit AaeB